MNKKGIAMHKEQNVIKLILPLLIFVLSTHLIQSQTTLIGKYSSLMSHQEHYDFFDFFENRIFEYHSGASLGDNEYGKGHYQIKNDSLILNYDLTELKYESYYKPKKYYNSKDSIEVNLRIKDFDNNPLNEINVITDPEAQSIDIDDKGLASLIFKKGSFKEKIKLYIDGAFWAECIIVLDSNTNYIIDVFMNTSEIIGLGHPNAIKGIEIKYQIVENSKNKLKLKNGDQVLTLEKRLSH